MFIGAETGGGWQGTRADGKQTGAATGEVKVLITGATGFLGTHIVKKFLEKGWNIVGLDKDCYVDVSKAKKLIDWDPAQGTVDALKETYDWYLANVSRFEGKIGLGHHGVLWRERLLNAVRDVLSVGSRIRR